jgi:adenosine kinase
MAVLICGSLAFDTIMHFEGRFKEQILPEQLHILNVSFLVPRLQRDFGGCAGNIAYSMKLLGAEPLPMATLGNDGASYMQRLTDLGIATTYVKTIEDTYTAQAMIMTDLDNNQITAFHPGAMMQAHVSQVNKHPDIRLGIISPDGRDAMLSHAQQMAEAGIPFVFDPGQGLPMFDGQELRHFIELATWVTVNDYEGKMLSDRTGWSSAGGDNFSSEPVIGTESRSSPDLFRQYLDRLKHCDIRCQHCPRYPGRSSNINVACRWWSGPARMWHCPGGGGPP